MMESFIGVHGVRLLFIRRDRKFGGIRFWTRRERSIHFINPRRDIIKGIIIRTHPLGGRIYSVVGIRFLGRRNRRVSIYKLLGVDKCGFGFGVVATCRLLRSLWPVVRESAVVLGHSADGRGAVGILATGGGAAVVVDCGESRGLADGTTTRDTTGRGIDGGGVAGAVIVVLTIILIVVVVVAVCGTSTGRRRGGGWVHGWIVHDAVGVALIQTESSRTVISLQ